jgi:hypothetical protein
LNPSRAFPLQLVGKFGSFVAASAGNDYHDAFLPGCRAASNPMPLIRSRD